MGLQLHSWFVSVVLHLVIASLGFLLILERPAVSPKPVKITLVGPMGSSHQTSGKMKEFLNLAQDPPMGAMQSSDNFSLSAPQKPTWQALLPFVKRKTFTDQPVWTSKELLLQTNDTKQDIPLSSLWDLKGETSQNQMLPPPPPAHLVPAGGQQWKLIFEVSGMGGYYIAVEGIDSGRLELDRWLEDHLRTMIFPPSPDRKNYIVHWTLRLKTVRPE